MLLCYSAYWRGVLGETQGAEYRTLGNSIWECVLPRGHAIYANYLEPIAEVRLNPIRSSI